MIMMLIDKKYTTTNSNGDGSKQWAPVAVVRVTVAIVITIGNV